MAGTSFPPSRDFGAAPDRAKRGLGLSLLDTDEQIVRPPVEDPKSAKACLLIEPVDPPQSS